MSNIYIQEPPTSGKVLLKTTVGDIEIELWARETPKACRNFVQLCMEGYYNNTLFHRVVKGFIAQGGDPTGTGEGGESIYDAPFKDEFHTRLRFCRRGLVAMANAGKDDNCSQFFFTLAATPELQNKNTIFGKVVGETLYNMLKLEETLVDENDRPIYPQKILKTEILNNPFPDIVPRTLSRKTENIKENKKQKKTGVKNFKLLSFGEEAEEDEKEFTNLSTQFNNKGKSAHDHLDDPKLSTQSVIEATKQKLPMKDKDIDSEDEVSTQKAEELATTEEEKLDMKERIKTKLKGKGKIIPESKQSEDSIVNEVDNLEEEYYLGKEKVEERKKQAEAIRKEIRDLKRSIQNDKKVEELNRVAEEEKKEQKRKHSEIMKDYLETQEKYRKDKEKLPKKGKSREDLTLDLLKKFRNKLQTVKESVKSESTSVPRTESKDDEEDDDESWMVHALHCEEKHPVLAKDASTKDDDWFEIYDPRNPLNKRRRGEKADGSKHDKGNRNRSHYK